ncbi:MAG: hypothetical protein QME66_13085, partial [Candidatus Eisenbacteria bacterium]|nr:hypothetical protein [Candidatus Eisenbacteria bacterium]
QNGTGRRFYAEKEKKVDLRTAICEVEKTASLCSEKVADMDRNRWPESIGITGRDHPEQAADFARNARPTSPEYA